VRRSPILTPRQRRPRARRHRGWPPSLRLGLQLRRHPLLWWVGASALALLTGGSVASVVESAESARAGWGVARAVVVVQRHLGPGARIGHGDLSLEERPTAAIPEGALEELPTGTLRADAYPGEVLVAGRLAPAGLSPLAASLPAGTRAVSVPVEAGGAPALQVGDHVDVLVALAPEAAGEGPPGFALARHVAVAAVEEGSVTIAVDPDVAAKVAVALASGAVTLALVGP
jgi:Flp pilus assembly protein CpaB